jgi:sec-independent protein translocase protein TatA
VVQAGLAPGIGRPPKTGGKQMEFPIHWLIVLVIVLILFGGRKIPELMRGFGEGIRSFREGMSGHPQQPTQSAPPAEKPAEEKK